MVKDIFDVPVVENLTTHHVSPHPPAVLVALLSEMVMAEELRIEIIGLVRGMVDMVFRTFKEEETMVINKFRSAVKMKKCADVPSILVMYQLNQASADPISLRSPGPAQHTSLGLKLNLVV